MLLNSFYAILGTFYTLLNNTDLDLSYFDLSYVFPGHNDSVEQGLTVLWLSPLGMPFSKIHQTLTRMGFEALSYLATIYQTSGI